jgi:ABC-type transport system involved in multi-copper enzyme maturation permease subunit
MNPAIMTTALRERFTNPGRIMLLAVVMIFGIVSAWENARSGGGVPDSGLTVILTLVLSTGLIGTDVSSGVIHLVFLRPVTRGSYVTSKWVAAAGASTGAAWFRLLVYTVAAFSYGKSPAATEIALNAVECALIAFGVAAVLVFLSSLGDGYADLRIYALLYLFGGLLMMVGQIRGEPVWGAMAEQINSCLAPQVDFGEAPGGLEFWFQLTSYLSTVTASIAAAIVLVNRRELTYASG